MPTDLELLIELARKHEMTASERDAQVRSFATEILILRMSRLPVRMLTGP
jgi:hypothetical protein